MKITKIIPQDVNYNIVVTEQELNIIDKALGNVPYAVLTDRLSTNIDFIILLVSEMRKELNQGR